MNTQLMTEMIEDLERLTNAVLEFRKATAFLEDEPEKTENWPQRAKGPKGENSWIDKEGTYFDPERHAINRMTKRPAITPSGFFRKRRTSK